MAISDAFHAVRRRFSRPRPRHALEVARSADLGRVISGVDLSARPPQALQGFALRVDHTRLLLRCASLEQRLAEETRQNDQHRITARLVRDLLQSSLRERAEDAQAEPSAAIERWLHDFLECCEEAFPHAGVRGVAVTARVNGRYEFRLRARLDAEASSLLPASADVDFQEWVAQRTNYARIVPFAVHETPHWCVVLTSAEAIDEDLQLLFDLVAVEVARAMQKAT